MAVLNCRLIKLVGSLLSLLAAAFVAGCNHLWRRDVDRLEWLALMAAWGWFSLPKWQLLPPFQRFDNFPLLAAWLFGFVALTMDCLPKGGNSFVAFSFSFRMRLYLRKLHHGKPSGHKYMVQQL